MYDILRQKSTQATGVVTRDADGDDGEETYIKVPISSTGVDRDGDEFSEDGVKNLRDQIKETPRPVYENHGFSGDKGIWDAVRYDWKDIIGSLDDAEIEAENGVDVLYGYIKPNPQNERGAQLAGYVKSEMPVGFSIGFGIGNADEKDAGGLTIHSSDLMEVSAVGIQSNRESVATNAADTAVAMVKGAGGLDDLDLDEQTLAKAMVDEMLDPDRRDDAKHNDPTDWVQKRFSDADGSETPSVTNDMENEDDPTDTDNELMKRVVDLQERQADQLDETNDSIEKLNDRLDDLETRADEDDEEDEGGEEDEEEDEDDDEKSFTIEVTSKSEEAIAELKKAAEDDTLDLDESKTKVAVRDADDVDAETADDNTGKAVF